MNLIELKIKCLEKKIPIIHDESIKYICQLINDNKITSVLEIGSGLGYSSYFIKEHTNITNITSIEKNIDNFNFITNNLSHTLIEYVHDDAFSYEPYRKYDFIFIDGPKNKQETLFINYSHFLNKKGIIIIDNILMNNLKSKIQTKRIINLIDKNEKFKLFLLSQNNWSISFLNIGDGLAICSKK